MAKADILAVAAKLGLTMTAEFVPFSQSRNSGEKMPNLNWKVTIHKEGRAVLTTDYGAGCAHCPGYKQGDRSVMQAELVAWECENGYPGLWIDNANVYRDIRRKSGSKPLMPDIADVLYSLAMDYEVIDHDEYEEWAENFGYDPDSRKGEAIYKACLLIALKLRNHVGEAGMAELREACQDY